MTPGVSILQKLADADDDSEAEHIRLALEVLHDIQKAVIDIGLVVELHFDLVKVSESILEITRC